MYKILINGKANSGKDEIYKLLVNRLCIDSNHKKIAFADPMKKMVMVMYPFLREEMVFGPSHFREKIIDGAMDSKGKPLTIRQLLLDLGKFGRTYNENTWINSVDYEIYNERQNSIIITDCRFRNEFSYAKKHNFYLIRIKRPNNTYKVNDISETDMDSISDSEFNEIIINDSSLDALDNKIKNTAENIRNHCIL